MRTRLKPNVKGIDVPVVVLAFENKTFCFRLLFSFGKIVVFLFCVFRVHVVLECALSRDVQVVGSKR